MPSGNSRHVTKNGCRASSRPRWKSTVTFLGSSPTTYSGQQCSTWTRDRDCAFSTSGPGGTFLAIAEALGHKAIGIDIEEPFYADLCSILAVDRRVCPVRPQQSLPDLSTRFDLVTIILQKFDHLATHPDGSRD
jgi:hypothetical protein